MTTVQYRIVHQVKEEELLDEVMACDSFFVFVFSFGRVGEIYLYKREALRELLGD